MNRRQFLAAAGIVAVVPTACGAQDTPTTDEEATQELNGIDRGGEKYPSGGLGLDKDAFEDLYGDEIDDEFSLFTSFEGEGDYRIDVWDDQFPAAHITLVFSDPVEFDVAKLSAERLTPDDTEPLKDEYFSTSGSFIVRYHSEWLATAHDADESEEDWWFWPNAEPGDFKFAYGWDPDRESEMVGTVTITLGDDSPESRES